MTATAETKEREEKEETKQTQAEDEATKIKKSLNYSIKDGAFASAMGGISDSYLPAYAVTLGASNRQIGLLTSLANLFGPLFQLSSLKMLRKGASRKKLVLIAVLLHALILIPILAIPFFFPEKYRVAILIALFSLYAIFANFPGPAWASWMGDLVPSKVRGEYFGRRNRIAGVVTIITTLLAGLVLNYFTKDKVFLAFALIFFAAAFFRLISLYYLSLKYEPKFVLNGGEKFSLIKFARRMRNDNFAKFVLFVTLMMLATSIAGPFFTPHALRDLKWNFITYTLMLFLIPGISSFLAMVYWGKNIDRFGSVAVLRFTTPLVCLLPLPWILAKGNIFIILLIQIIAGAVWAGFNLAVFTFINDSSTQQQRALFFTYFNIINGAGIFIGANLGGFLSDYRIPILPNIFVYSVFTAFLISSILRTMIAAYFLPQIKEVKAVESGKPRFEIFGIDTTGIVRKAVVGIYVGSEKIRKARWRKLFKGKFLFYNKGELLSAKSSSSEGLSGSGSGGGGLSGSAVTKAAERSEGLTMPQAANADASAATNAAITATTATLTTTTAATTAATTSNVTNINTQKNEETKA